MFPVWAPVIVFCKQFVFYLQECVIVFDSRNIKIFADKFYSENKYLSNLDIFKDVGEYILNVN